MAFQGDLDPDMRADLEEILKGTVSGCPVADHRGACITTCAGNVPGAMISTEKLVEAVVGGTIIPDRIACGVVAENAQRGLDVREAFVQSFELERAGVLFTAPAAIEMI